MELRFWFSLAVLSSAAACAQTLMTAPDADVRLLPADASVLASPEQKSDIKCTVKPAPPRLGFDLGFRSGYELHIPLRDLGGNGNRLTAIFSVTPENQPDGPVYFSQHWDVPALDMDAPGSAAFSGTFILGEGNYQINWLLRDRQERFCSARWKVSVDRSARDSQFQLRVPAGAVLPDPNDPFFPETPVVRHASSLFHVLILLHVSPLSPGAAGLSPLELDALASILRIAAREPRIGSYSIAAFNLEHNEVLFRQRDVPEISFPELGGAIGRLKLGVVQVQRLSQDNTRMQFLGTLLAEEIAAAQPDAVIFIGPKVPVHSLTSQQSLKALLTWQCPVFYLNYGADAALHPWRDAIGSAARSSKDSEYVITRPRDVAVAWANVMERLSERRTAAGSPRRTGIVKGLIPKK